MNNYKIITQQTIIRAVFSFIIELIYMNKTDLTGPSGCLRELRNKVKSSFGNP